MNPSKADENAPPTDSRAAQLGLGTTLIAILGLFAITAPFLRRFTGAPYVASSMHARRAIVQHMRKLRHTHKGEMTLIDLGSGGGELVIEAAVVGFQARGVELNRWLIALSRFRAWKAQVRRYSFHRQCLWATSLHNDDMVVVFGVPAMMNRLATKLSNECKPGAWVASNTFQIPHWHPEKHVGGVYFYIVAKKPHASRSSLGLSQLAR